MVAWLRVLFIVLLLIILGVGTILAQEQAELIILSEPVVDLENNQVSLSLIVRNDRGLPVVDLNAANFEFGEPVTGVTVDTVDSLPVNMAVIVNLSQGADVPQIQDTLRAYFDNETYYQPDDTIIFYILGTEDSLDTPQVIQADSKDQIDRIIDNFQESDGLYSITNTLNLSRERLESLLAVTPERSGHVLYVGSSLNNESESQNSAEFASSRIGFYVVQAHRFWDEQTVLHRALALKGGGQFVDNQNSSSVLEEDGVLTPINNLKVLYDVIASSRKVYELSYTPTSADPNLNRTVELTAIITDTVRPSASFTYEWAFQPPVIRLDNLTNLSPIRDPFWEDGVVRIDDEENTIYIDVTFPNEIERDIQFIALTVNESETGRLLQSQIETAPEVNEDGLYMLNWSLVDYDIPGTTILMDITVEVTDVFNLSASVTASARVVVRAVPTVTPMPSPTLAPRPTPAIETNDAVSNSVVMALGGVVLALTLLTLVLFIAWLRLRRSRPQVEYVPAPQPEPSPQPTDVVEDQQPVVDEPLDDGEKEILGKLFVLHGLPERVIYITEPQWVVGRDAKRSTFTIDEVYVSPQHCSIKVDAGNYSIMDLGSKNGTFINGERLEPKRSVMVPVGSEIEITRKIKLELWDPKTQLEHQTDHESNLTPQSESQNLEDDGELQFRPLLDIPYVEDDVEEIDDDYSPI